jgi:hypothetical protein
MEGVEPVHEKNLLAWLSLRESHSYLRVEGTKPPSGSPKAVSCFKRLLCVGM